ncbi:MAG: Fic family protein [Oscillospiraceae bacterium]|nr:Fic family protein [Oscillospiraceae bacterium]
MNQRYYYEYEWDSEYCYPHSHVLKNKLNITDQAQLEEAERAITSLKMAQASLIRIRGRFGIAHLKRMHKFLFEDIYPWAGQFRTVNISKGNQFCRADYIEPQLAALFDALKRENYLKDCSNVSQISKRLSYYLGEINVIHPFREGNGRTQRLFIETLADNDGYTLDFSKISDDEMLEASVFSYEKDYSLMDELMLRACIKKQKEA